jgi:hypothetical protein
MVPACFIEFGPKTKLAADLRQERVVPRLGISEVAQRRKIAAAWSMSEDLPLSAGAKT